MFMSGKTGIWRNGYLRTDSSLRIFLIKQAIPGIFCLEEFSNFNAGGAAIVCGYIRWGDDKIYNRTNA